MEPAPQSNLINVRDLGLAAALVSIGFAVKEIEWDRNRASFIFVHSDSLQDAMQGYWAGTLVVKARLNFEAAKMLKGRIYGEKGL